MPKVSPRSVTYDYDLPLTDLYTLAIDCLPTKITILMKLLINEISTRYFPQTYSILQLYLPTIYSSVCYNDDNLPFFKEVANTELGHLFEHILLEYLCIQKLEKGLDFATYEGVTNWNWINDPKGTFYITIYTSSHDRVDLYSALKKTMILMNIILSKQNSIDTTLLIPPSQTQQ